MYDDQQLSHGRVIRLGLQLVHDIFFLHPHGNSRRAPTCLLWEFSLSPFIKINVDGLAQGNPALAGAGNVSRNVRGIALAVMGLALGTSSNVAAELLALKEGILSGLSFGFHHIKETDFMLAVQWMKHQCVWPWRYFQLLRELLELIAEHHIQVVLFFVRQIL